MKRIDYFKSIENISGSPRDFTWSSSGQYIVFQNVDVYAGAGYLGESAYPGISYNRMNELGDNLGNRDDNILVANWKVEIINDDSITPDEIYEDSFPTEQQRLVGEVSEYRCGRPVVSGGW